MKSIVLSFLLFVLSALLIVPHILDGLVEQHFMSFIPMALMVLAMLIQVDAIAQIKGRARIASLQVEHDRLVEETTKQTEKLHDAKRQLTGLRSKLVAMDKAARDAKETIFALKNERDEIKRAQSDLELALKDSQLQTLTAKNGKAKGMSNEIGAISLLRLLQDKGRFVDFLMDDISKYPDQQVGAASRVVHSGCRKVLNDAFGIRPLRKEDEGSTVEITNEDHSHAYRLIGQIKGDAPFSGKMLHRGWVAERVLLPVTVDESSAVPAKIIAPAEVEVAQV